MSEHTPGPWKVGKGSWDDIEYWVVETPEGAIVCSEPIDFYAYDSGAFISPEGHGPNAHLIAAAPELLLACERLYARLDSAEQAYGGVAKQAAAAIAKAKEMR